MVFKAWGSKLAQVAPYTATQDMAQIVVVLSFVDLDPTWFCRLKCEPNISQRVS